MRCDLFPPEERRKNQERPVGDDGLLEGANGECRRLLGSAATRVWYSNKANDE